MKQREIQWNKKWVIRSAEDELNPKNLAKKAEVSVDQMKVGPECFFVSSIYVF